MLHKTKIFTLIFTLCFFMMGCSKKHVKPKNEIFGSVLLDPVFLTKNLLAVDHSEDFNNVKFEVKTDDLAWRGTIKVRVIYDGHDCGAFHSYEYIGTWNGYEILFITWSGGGSGIFTDIGFFKKNTEDNNLDCFFIGTGDRAFGGTLRHPTFYNGILHFYRFLSDYELAHFAGINSHLEISGSASSVSAIGFFTFDPEKKEEKFIRLRLINPGEHHKDHDYSEILYKYINDGRIIFDQKELKGIFSKDK